MRYSLILLMALIALSLGIHYFADQDSQASQNPERDLHELTLRDPELGQALADADKGDVAGLTTWLNRAEKIDRVRVAKLLIELTIDPKKNKTEPDLALCWKYRNRFRAFINLSTSIDKLDIGIDNLLAYALVAGTPTPSAADLSLARSLEVRLTREARDNDDPELEDTVGCSDVAAQDFAAARDAFALSLTWVSQLHDDGAASLLKLEQARKAAADHNYQVMAHDAAAASAALGATGTSTGAAIAPDADGLLPLPSDEAVTADQPKS
jgi:hypothetical protein